MVIVAIEDTRNSEWSKSTTGFGQKMLSKMGWSDGQGLGKNGQGNNLHLRAIRRAEETQGIGVTIDNTGSNGWDKTNTNFQSILTSLQQNHIPNNDDDDDDNDNKKKKKKSKNGKRKKKTDLILAQNRVTTGHSKKWRNAKDLSTKSREDIAAIFGTTVSNITATTPIIKSYSSNNDKTTTEKSIPNNNDTTIPTISSDSSITMDEANNTTSSKKKNKKEKKKKSSSRKRKNNDDNSSDECSKIKKKKKTKK